MENVIEIQDLRKDYGDFCLSDVSFTLPKGYIMGLIGPNGAGKTTIIKLIMNLIKKNHGGIKLFGEDHIDSEVTAKARIGFVYDNPSFYNHLNLKQIKKIIAPFYRTWDEKIFIQLVERFDLPLNKALRKFSRGMVMKSAIVLALSHHADLIIMDEPTSGLDPIFRRELLDLLFDLLQNENKSILFSTHITSDIEKIADYITFVLDGRIVFSDRKDDILAKYAIVKGGHEILNKESSALFQGIRKNEFGFEALTSKAEQAREQFGTDIVFDKASLEDIMYFCDQRDQHV